MSLLVIRCMWSSMRADVYIYFAQIKTSRKRKGEEHMLHTVCMHRKAILGATPDSERSLSSLLKCRQQMHNRKGRAWGID